METVTIGFLREHGDFMVLATLNNRAGQIDPKVFKALCKDTARRLQETILEKEITLLERQDTPDHVDLE